MFLTLFGTVGHSGATARPFAVPDSRGVGLAARAGFPKGFGHLIATLWT